jgi:hypothetical protein
MQDVIDIPNERLKLCPDTEQPILGESAIMLLFEMNCEDETTLLPTCELCLLIKFCCSLPKASGLIKTLV